MLDASATTSFGLLYLLFHWAETSRIQAKSEHCLMYLKKIAVNSMSLISEGGGRCYLDNGEFNFSAAGVCNVFESLQWCHGGIRDSLAASWSEMRENGKLSTEMTHASIIDLVLFLAVVRRHRRQLKKHSWTSRITDVFCQSDALFEPNCFRFLVPCSLAKRFAFCLMLALECSTQLDKVTTQEGAKVPDASWRSRLLYCVQRHWNT